MQLPGHRSILASLAIGALVAAQALAQGTIPSTGYQTNPLRLTRTTSTTGLNDSSVVTVCDSVRPGCRARGASFGQLRKFVAMKTFDSVVTTKLNLTGATVTGTATWSSLQTFATAQRVDSATGAARSQILTTARALWGQNFDGSAAITGSLTSVGNITGGASSMTILAGTGASRTLTLQTTNVSSVAISPLVLGADSSVTVLGKLVPNSTKGIVGTATNDAANAGSVGEIMSHTTVAGSAVTLTTATTANVDSLTLTAGDWDVTCVVGYVLAATTSVTNLTGGVNTTTATLGALGTKFDFETAANVMTATNNPEMVCPTSQALISGSTKYYLVAQATFTVSTAKAYGIIRARRVR
jgi:hypothetical protein